MKISSLHDFKTEKSKCLILGCGPSLKEVNVNKIKDMAKDHLIVTIKQAYFQFKNVSEMQFFNCNNFIKYHGDDTVFVCCSPFDETSGRRFVWGDQKIDLHYQIKSNKKFSEFNNLEDYFAYKNIGLFKGPGIMYEAVMPIIYNLRIKEIKTVGWDYHDREGFVEHFYLEEKRKKLINPAHLPYNGENLESIENSKKLKMFFDSKGVSLKAFKSDKCFLDKSIERIKL